MAYIGILIPHPFIDHNHWQEAGRSGKLGRIPPPLRAAREMDLSLPWGVAILCH